jgi:hypothetical protein
MWAFLISIAINFIWSQTFDNYIVDSTPLYSNSTFSLSASKVIFNESSKTFSEMNLPMCSFVSIWLITPVGFTRGMLVTAILFWIRSKDKTYASRFAPLAFFSLIVFYIATLAMSITLYDNCAFLFNMKKTSNWFYHFIIVPILLMTISFGCCIHSCTIMWKARSQELNNEARLDPLVPL